MVTLVETGRVIRFHKLGAPVYTYIDIHRLEASLLLFNTARFLHIKNWWTVSNSDGCSFMIFASTGKGF